MSTGRDRLTWRVVLPGCVVLAVVLGTGAYVVTLVVGGSPTRCERSTSFAAERLTDDAGAAGAAGAAGPRVVVIGDSYSVGVGLDEPLESWPDRLSGQVHVAGFSGSGFAASPCGATSYAERALAAVVGGPDLVVVEGGLNDVGLSARAIDAGFDKLMTELDGLSVLVVGPPPAPSRAAPAVRVDRLLASLAAAHHVDYLSLVDADLPYLPDELHLTAEGHQEFGDLVAARISQRTPRTDHQVDRPVGHVDPLEPVLGQVSARRAETDATRARP